MLVPADEGDAVAVAAAPELEAAELAAELELELELHATAPASRQAPAPAAAIRHLELVLIRGDILVKRVIAPRRLSAVNSPVYGPSSARCCRAAGVQN